MGGRGSRGGGRRNQGGSVCIGTQGGGGGRGRSRGRDGCGCEGGGGGGGGSGGAGICCTNGAGGSLVFFRAPPVLADSGAPRMLVSNNGDAKELKEFTDLDAEDAYGL